MPKRCRAVPLSFPTVFFACLLLTTCAHAQDDVASRPGELVVAPINILQLLLENQQVTPGTPVSASDRGHGISVRTVPFNLSTVYLADVGNWSVDTDLVPAPASTQRRQITPAQYFGNGTQAAP
jgi:hypothetical protein